jgi:DNA-binding NarL/FixJ family response regulator
MFTVDIIDDNTMMAHSLGSTIGALGSNFKLGKVWTKPEEFLLDLTHKHCSPPSLVLLDFRMPCLLGSHVSYLLQKKHPHIKKIGLSSDVVPSWINSFMATGCKGFISKSDSLQDLETAIQTVLQGNYYRNLYVTEDMVATFTNTKIEMAIPYNLSWDEYFLIHLSQSDLTNENIADVLDIDKEILHKKRSKLYKDFNVHSRQGLVNFATDKEIIKYYKFYS